MTRHGWKDATNDETQIRAWWTRTPDANVAIACGPSGLAVLDIDHGLKDGMALLTWQTHNQLPRTFTVRTGRRPEYGFQLYYTGAIPDVGEWALDGCTGQVKSAGGYVMGPGCVHPDSKEKYECTDSYDPVETPNVMRQLKTKSKPSAQDDGSPIIENRNVRLTVLAGKMRNAGANRDELEAYLLRKNAERCQPPLEEEEVRQIAKHAAEWELPKPEPVAVIGTAVGLEPTPLDWREHYHTRDEIEHAPPVTFLIDGFLPDESIAGLAAPAGQRKSLIALNVAHSLCTGEDLFGRFKVLKKPSRVLYLCPEMGIRAFTDRLRKIGLLDHVGNTLFCRTMSKPGMLELDELQPDEVQGAVVILDTAIRYLKGDENSSEHMRKFAASVFKLSEMGAASILVLHHSAKGTKESNELTLENAMRGSGELGAFLTTCWATRLQDPTEPYKSASYLANVKQRDFESCPFEVNGSEGTQDCRLHYVESTSPVTLRPRNQFKPNNDGKDEAALAVIQAHITTSERDTVALLAGYGIKRSRDWIRKKKFDLMQERGGLMPAVKRT